VLLDWKAACRELLRYRWFTFVTVLTLALGIRANTAIFGVVNRLLLTPLPYPDSERLVYISMTAENGPAGFRVPAPTSAAAVWRERAHSLDSIESYTALDVLAYDENGARVLHGMRITPGLTASLGVPPLLGRAFTPADAQPGAPAVALLSYELWQRDYAGAADVIGSAVTLDETSHVVVGVLPPRWAAFAGSVGPEIWLPQQNDSTFGLLDLMGRLRPGVPIDAAVTELDAILAETRRPTFGGQALKARLDRPADRLGRSTRDALLVLLVAVGLVLLVACSNVANLLLTRGASRARELSLRSALGASTGRLVRALFAQCLLLALMAGVAGIAVGWLTMRVLVRLRPDSLSQLDAVSLDSKVLGYTLAVTVTTAVLFGVAPALQLASRKVGGALRQGASGVVRGGAAPRLRKLLVGVQMALAVVVLVSAGLLLRSFIHLQRVDVGFDAANLFTAELRLPGGRYREAAALDLLSDQLRDRVRSSPGVAAVTQAVVAPTRSMVVVGNLEIRGTALGEPDAPAPHGINDVRPDYFRTLGIPLFEGRTFTSDDARHGTAVIVNQAAARQLWPGGGALGSELKLAGSEWATVVGVVGNVVAGGLTESRDTPLFYWPLTFDVTFNGNQSVLLIVRAIGDPAIAIASLRAAARDLDPEIAIDNVLMTETALASSIDAPRFNMALLTAFAIITLVLAAVGLAAVIGHEVTERTHEIGIRLALGARAESVRRVAMRQGLAPAFLGMVCGTLAALPATRFAASMLYGVAPRDPLTFVSVVALLTVVAIGASWLPASHAARVDPLVALRAD
jgi:predicted permease